MDSRSGPELPQKVHAFREAVKGPRPRTAPACARTTRGARPVERALLGLLGLLLSCAADPTTVEGALSRAASAVASGDHAALYDSLDERSRVALASVYFARKQAARVIREQYPSELRERALSELGDAVRAESPADLFRQRCGEDCMHAFAETLGAPRAVEARGAEARVETVRGTHVELHRADNGRYGLVWETEQLVRERTRSAAELDLIQKNGELYRSQRALK